MNAGMLSGLWHAHMGWFFQPEPPNLSHYVKDLRQSSMLRMVSARSRYGWPLAS